VIGETGLLTIIFLLSGLCYLTLCVLALSRNMVIARTNIDLLVKLVNNLTDAVLILRRNNER
jgi:hypothetical protein